MRKLAIAGVAALATLGAAASSAQAAKISLDYKCTYPLIGPQDLHLDIDAIIPEVVQRNVTTPAFQINATASTTADTWDGIDIIGASTIEGTSDARASISLPGGFTLPVKVPIVVPVYTVPKKRGPLVILASGKTPPLTFPTNGQAPITIKSIALNLIAKDSTGKILQLPPVDVDSDDDPDTFDVACTLNPATQSTLLTTITIQEGPVDTTPTTPVNVKPTAPGKPAVSAITQTGASVSWAASTDDVAVAGYDVFDGATKVGSTTTATTFALTGLTAGSTHNITVVARDGGTPSLSSDASAATSFTTLPPTPVNVKPTAPGKPAITAITQTGATATWAASTDDGTVVGYDVFEGATKLGSTTTATTLAISGFTAGSTHSITVVARDNGTPSLSSDASAATSFTTLPPTPVNVKPTAPGKPVISAITQTAAVATWAASTDDGTVTGYDVFDGATKLGSTTTATTLAISGFTAGSTHSITVVAHDNGTPSLSSDASAATSFTTLPPTPVNVKPTAPGKPVISAITQTAAVATWAASTDDGTVTGYDVFDGATKLGSTTTATTLAISGFTAGSTHSITVVAHDNGTPSLSSDASAATSFTTLPPTPVNVKPTAPGKPAITAITQTGATATWTASTDDGTVVGYDVFDGATKIGSTTTATTFAITGLTASTTHTITVVARDNGTPSLSSDASAATPFTTLPPTPVNVKPSKPGTPSFTAITKTSATATWAASTDDGTVTGYDVYLDGVKKTTSATATANLTGLTAGKTYAVTVIAKDNGTPSLSSDASAAGSLTTLAPDPPVGDAPTVTKVSGYGFSGLGGFATITGTNFKDIVSVQFGTAKARLVFPIGTKQIIAIAPALSAGSYDVIVTTKAGASAPSVKYTYKKLF